ncbi:hypothetical protein THOG11_120005 [Vibrio harveyi]|nr:hypothetical protein TH15OA1_410007 [Vibrio harveyi]CAH1548185.1 hypothetical protein THOD03_110005 [Vibrio harveyi]CAH1552216.1 hypothetical protein THOG11_120005 [Vibrio harveyi]
MIAPITVSNNMERTGYDTTLFSLLTFGNQGSDDNALNSASWNHLCILVLEPRAMNYESLRKQLLFTKLEIKYLIERTIRSPLV